MVTVRAAVTAAVVIVNEAEFWPEGITTPPLGTIALELLDCSWTVVAPTIGALSAMVTVPLTVFPLPPTTELFAKTSCKAGTTMIGAVWLLRPSVAVMLQVWLAVTTEVGMEKVAELDPYGTETVVGGCAAVLSLEIPILTPPGGAVPVSATVADTLFPPSTLAGATDNVDSCSALAGSISSAAVWLAPAACPVMVAV